MGAYGKIRKYLLALSTLGCLGALAHLAFLYAFVGSVPVPQDGGNIAVGIVGRAPKLTLLDPRPESSNELVLRFLFRGVLRYNPETRKVEGDVAHCDVANLADVRCFMNPETFWNDGQPLTAHDVAATYDLYRASLQNKRLAAIMAGMKVTEGRDSVRFQFPTADVGSLEVLFLPVLRATQTQTVTQDGFSLANMSFSGPFAFVGREYDPEYGVEKVILERNEFYGLEKIYVARFTLKFFNSQADLARSRDALHVIYSPDQGGPASDSPRLADVPFLRPQYYAFFLNAESLPLPLRRALTSSVFPVASAAVPVRDAAAVTDPFLGSFRPAVSSGSDVASALAEMGYFRKDEWVRRLSLTGAAVAAPAAVPAPAAKPAAVAQKLSWWRAPAVSPTFTGANNVLLSGTVPEGTDAVGVNGYRLSKFAAGDKVFYYRAAVSQGTLKEGRNEFKARFLKDGKELASETAVVQYAAEAAALEAARAAWEGSSAPAPAVLTGSAAAVPAPSADRLAAARGLDERFFYGPDLKPFHLQLAYLTPLSGVADALANALIAAGVDVERSGLDDADLAAYVTGGGKPYDVLVAGISLGVFGYNLYPYFHSGQAETGYNFSKVRDAQLDALLEKLRADVRSGDSLVALQAQVSKALSDLAVFYPLHSPYLHFLVDKNLRGLPKFDTLPSSSYLSDVLRGTHIRETRSPVWEGKTLGGFSDFLAQPFSQP